jgi:fumarate reductase flavoprotein subunit
MNDLNTKNIQDRQVDIVIIGAGGAGLAAAAAAAEKGVKRILILEERKFPGGNAIFPEGIFAADSPVQKRLGVVCTKDDIFKKAMDYAHWRINPRLIRTLINKSGDTIRWLEEKGVEFENIAPIYPNDTPSTFHVVRGPGKTGAAVIRALLKNCRDMNVEILFQHRGRKLLTNARGDIIGVLAEAGKNEIKISTKNVILATGGFTGNTRMLKKYLPNYNHKEINHTGTLRNGDGIKMAAEIGAATEDMFSLEILGPFIKSNYLFFIVMRPENVWVNKRGERFADENISARFTESANSICRQPGKISYILLNESLKDKFIQDVLNKQKSWATLGSPEIWANRVNDEIISQAEKGKVKISGSWDDIAEWMGVEPEILKHTVDMYNSFCENGYDDDYIKDKKYLIPINKPPYYAIQCCVDCVATHGGIKINHRMEVVDSHDYPIKGLYAAGVETGGTESETYNVGYPGHSFGFTINTGRIAGENAAQFVKQSL